MADRLIKVLAEGRISAPSFSHVSLDTLQALVPDTAVTTVKIDYTRWLGVATLSSVAATGSSLTVSVSTATPSTTLTLSAVSGFASVEVTATASDGRKHTLWINFNEIDRTMTGAV